MKAICEACNNVTLKMFMPALEPLVAALENEKAVLSDEAVEVLKSVAIPSAENLCAGLFLAEGVENWYESLVMPLAVLRDVSVTFWSGLAIARSQSATFPSLGASAGELAPLLDLVALPSQVAFEKRTPQASGAKSVMKKMVVYAQGRIESKFKEVLDAWEDEYQFHTFAHSELTGNDLMKAVFDTAEHKDSFATVLAGAEDMLGAGVFSGVHASLWTTWRLFRLSRNRSPASPASRRTPAPSSSPRLRATIRR